MMFDMTELQRQLKKKDHGLSLRSDIQDWPPSGDGDEIPTAKGGRISDLRRTHIDLRASGDLRMSKGTTESGMLLRFESDRRDKEEAETWVNEMLEEAGIEPIETLTDLSDGLTLAQASIIPLQLHSLTSCFLLRRWSSSRTGATSESVPSRRARQWES